MTLRRRHLILAGATLLATVVLMAILLELGVFVSGESNAGLLIMTGSGALLLLWVGGYFLEARFRSRMRDLIDRVRRMSRGDFEARPSRSEYPYELNDLAGVLHDLAEQLSDRLGELERQRDEMQAIIDSIAEGVIAFTDDARVLRMNASAAELLDVSRPQAFTPIGTLVRHPELRDHLEESVILPLKPRELRMGERHLLVSSYLMAEGGSVVTLLDVTMLRQMERVRRDFVANASHELKTPLTVVRGYAETLLEEEPPEPLRRQFLESIRTHTLRLQNLVDDLLDLSRVESGTLRLTEEEVGLAKMAREVWAGLSSDPHPENVQFKIDGDSVALGDSQAVHQVLGNLFDNALRHTSAGGTITVKIAPSGPVVRVSVADSGSGIASSDLPRIFERFYRADSGRDRSVGGTGLGLAIVRHLVQSMGGEVGAESELGRGTTIHFTLPRVAEDEV